jgi:hypothetical protein
MEGKAQPVYQDTDRATLNRSSDVKIKKPVASWVHLLAGA